MSRTPPSPSPSRSLGVVGAGPRTLVLLQRLGAQHAAADDGSVLDVHVVDPYDSGAGRVWRQAQDPLLWMNSRAADISVLPDESVTGLAEPVLRGPSLAGWVHENRADLVHDAAAAGDDLLREEVLRHEPGSFTSRRLASGYFADAWARTLAGLPAGVRVHRHARTVLDLTDDPRDGRQVLHLAGQEETLTVDAVLLVQGHLDVRPGPRERRIATFARTHGLAYVRPGYTGDQDLDVLRPGSDVVVVGMGLAFVDLVVRLTEGRGGRFTERPDGSLDYHPSGREPRLHVGSRRGVPYRSKIGYETPKDLGLPRHYSAQTVADLHGDAPLDLRADLWPLIVKELAGAHYRELFRSHPGRTALAAAEFDARFSRAAWGSAEVDDLVERSVPDPADRFDAAELDRPLDGWWGTSGDEVHERVLQHLEDDRTRRADARHSPDAAVVAALLSAYVVTAGLHAAGRLNARSSALDVDGWWHGFFSYVASGPPPQRLRQLSALARAGLLRFLGAGLNVVADPGAGSFTASSDSGPHEVRAQGLVEARLPVPDLERTSDVLLTRLRERGDVRAHQVLDGETRLSNGRLVVDGRGRLVRDDGSPHPRRFATGAWVSGEGAAAAFARPGTNAELFRRADRLAADLLRAGTSAPPTPRSVPTALSELPGDRR
ncbi:FAD/NAD(P)-binding protein [Kineococcus rhizosphaerae]|uniref:FAD-NAD(P)-binding protein n=1 Tax=Kineococcus rhizosphaerae TaxID=559628 RepID=A0A2T0QXX3_9ACTN|nr:FAD/NAD(P)-binding protein [Kineococcus rhizosphaerae]PRY11053.1 FAD-NAD(P)-binding protein [Kineococcus rhizosphaerae]